MIPVSGNVIEFKLISRPESLTGIVDKWGLLNAGVYWLIVKDVNDKSELCINMSQISYYRIVGAFVDSEEQENYLEPPCEEQLKYDKDLYSIKHDIPDEYKKDIKNNIRNIVEIEKRNKSELRKTVSNILSNKTPKKLGFKYEVPNLTKHTKK
jgi:hypothetical protein